MLLIWVLKRVLMKKHNLMKLSMMKQRRNQKQSYKIRPKLPPSKTSSPFSPAQEPVLAPTPAQHSPNSSNQANSLPHPSPPNPNPSGSPY